MIDEEDEEEILKKGLSFKTVLKNLVLILMIIIGAVLIYTGSGENQMINFFLGFSLVCIGSTLIQFHKPPSEPIRQTLTILKCALCNITKVRNYTHGDFVFKKIEFCDSCNESMEINQIYSVKLKKSTAPNKKEETKKKTLKVKT